MVLLTKKLKDQLIIIKTLPSLNYHTDGFRYDYHLKNPF